MRLEWAFGQIPQGEAADLCITVAQHFMVQCNELASAKAGNRNRNWNGNRKQNWNRKRQRNRNSNVKGKRYKNRDIIYLKLF